MDAGEYCASSTNDSGSRLLLWRNGTNKERAKYDDDVNDLDWCCQCALGNLRI